MTAGDPRVCAFCARPKAQVRNLIAGDGMAGISVGICESCVSSSFDILVKSGALAVKTAPPAAAAPVTDAPTSIRTAVRTAPRSLDISVLRDLAHAGVAVAAGNAAQLRSLAYELGNAMAFELALEVRTHIAAFERTVADSLADATYHTRIGLARQGVAELDRLSKGPLAQKMTPTERLAAQIAGMEAQLAALSWDNDLRAMEAELTRMTPTLSTVVTDAGYLRGLQNQVVHVRARGATALHDDAGALRILVEHLAVRELDLEALALAVDLYERKGDRASAARAREKAMKYIHVGSAYAKRLAGER